MTTYADSIVEVKRGDKVPTYWQAVIKPGSQPVDLTGATTRLLAQNARFGGATMELEHSVVDPLLGAVMHVTDGTLPVGDYNIELEISVGSDLKTAPTCNFGILRICRDLG